jgi:hypothetical protein
MAGLWLLWSWRSGSMAQAAAPLPSPDGSFSSSPSCYRRGQQQTTVGPATRPSL